MASTVQAPEIIKILLDKIKIRVRQTISGEVADSIRMMQEPEFVTSTISSYSDNMSMMLEATLLGENLGEVLVKYPADWWEAFKERWFSIGLKEKYPVKYMEHKFRQYALYPDVHAPSLPEQRQVYILK